MLDGTKREDMIRVIKPWFGSNLSVRSWHAPKIENREMLGLRCRGRSVDQST